MFYSTTKHVDAIIEAASYGRRFAIYGLKYFDPFLQCVDRGVFDNLKYFEDYVIVDDDPRLVGKSLDFNKNHVGAFGPIQPFDFMTKHEFKSVVILHSTNHHKDFHRIATKTRIPFGNIFLEQPQWDNRCGRTDDILENVLSKCLGKINEEEGGVSPDLPSQFVDCLIEIKRRNIPGDILNLGVYKGWSMQFLAEVCNEIGLRDRVIFGFDTFEGFPEEERHAFDGFMPLMRTLYDPKIGCAKNIHKDTSLEYVAEKLSKYNVRLIKGDFTETVREIDTMRLSFAFFDMDDYTPTKVGLLPAYKALSCGGFIVHDHYTFPTCAKVGTYGQRIAMMEFMDEYPMFNISGTNIFTKT